MICSAITIYYNLLLAYSLIYLWDSFKSPLPWLKEDNGDGLVWDAVSSRELFREKNVCKSKD